MSPPPQQLIRDYLSRLSTAARAQLDPADRRALVDRTRDFIERQTAADGPPTAVEVAVLLAGLGDPGGLVSQERQRLAALRGEAFEPVSRGRLARALRGDPGKVRGASWHWPVQPGSRGDLQVTLIDGDGPAAGARAVTGAATNREPAWPAVAESADELTLSPAPAAGGDLTRPLWPGLTAPTADDGFTRPEIEADPANKQTRSAATPDVPPVRDATVSWELAMPAELPVPHARQVLAGVASWSRQHKLEAVAVVLLGVGGAVFPPVWLLGAGLALASRLWDSRDKRAGLSAPVLLTVIAAAVGLVVGSHQSLGHGMHDCWVYAVDASRITALLSGCYLARRAVRGRRPPAVPPWSKPRRVS
jgi:hypothetical protein